MWHFPYWCLENCHVVFIFHLNSLQNLGGEDISYKNETLNGTITPIGFLLKCQPGVGAQVLVQAPIP